MKRNASNNEVAVVSETELATVSSLQSQANEFLWSLEQVQDVDQMRKVFAQLSVLKAALEAADQFRQASVHYAQLEAYALIRAVELNDGYVPKEIKGNYRKAAARWLYEMPDSERSTYIDMCTDGLTIDQVYKREIVVPEQERAKEHEKVRQSQLLKSASKEAVEQLNRTGMVKLTKISERHFRTLDDNVRNAFVDKVRDDIRRHDGCGLGDGDGTYISISNKHINSQDFEDVHDAIEQRIQKIADMFERVAEIIAKCERKPMFEITVPEDEDSLTFSDFAKLVFASCDAGYVKCHDSHSALVVSGVAETISVV